MDDHQTVNKRKKMLGVTTFAFAIVWSICFPLVTGYPGFDLEFFMKAAAGDLTNYYYTPWGLHFFQLLQLAPYQLAYIIVNLINVIGIYIATRTFRGDTAAVMVSYSLLFSIFYGQPDGLWAVSLVLMYHGIRKENTTLAVAGWFIALTKYYICFPLGVGLIWCYASRKQALQITTVTAGLILLSFIVYGPWPLEILARWTQKPPFDNYAIDLWQYVGPMTLLLWLPIIVNRNRDYRLFVATWALTTPYLHPHGLTHALVVMGPLAWTNLSGYFLGFGKQLILLQFAPLIVYILGVRRMVMDKLNTSPTQTRQVSVTE